MKIAVISFNTQGSCIAKKLSEVLDVELYFKEDNKDFNIMNLTKDLMDTYEGIIFISSTGIAVRSIAPYIKGKDVDPAVLVIDVFGKYVISLLSGHLGGANALALKIAKLIGSEPIITTATDNLGIDAPDIIAKENNLIIDNLKDAKAIAALLVAGEKVAFIDEDKNHKINIPKGYTDSLEEIMGVVYITNKILRNENANKKIKTLKLIRKDIILGIGCKKDYSSEKMKETVLKKLEELNIDKRAVKLVTTIEVKKDEKAIIELTKFLGCEFRIYTKDEIRKVQNKYEGSDFVEKNIGVRSVCEPAVELAGGKLLTNKMNLEGMTLCVGEVIE